MSGKTILPCALAVAILPMIFYLRLCPIIPISCIVYTEKIVETYVIPILLGTSVLSSVLFIIKDKRIRLSYYLITIIAIIYITTIVKI